VAQRRVSAHDACGHVDPRLGRIVHAMEANLDAPLGARELGTRAGISVRQLERLIRDRFGDTPMRCCLKLRLQAARNHLLWRHADPGHRRGLRFFLALAHLPRPLRADATRLSQPVQRRSAEPLPALDPSAPEPVAGPPRSIRARISRYL